MCCQELWVLLHSACGNASGIPQMILDEKAEELRKKKEMQDAINVWLVSSCAMMPCQDEPEVMCNTLGTDVYACMRHHGTLHMVGRAQANAHLLQAYCMHRSNGGSIDMARQLHTTGEAGGGA